MILTERHIINPNSEFYSECDNLCFKSKNLYNYVNYIIRQEFINSSKLKSLGELDHANYLNFSIVNRILVDSKQVDYYDLPCKVSNYTLMVLDKNWKSFFALCKLYSKNRSSLNGKPNLPKYLHKTKGRFVTTYDIQAISKKHLKNNIISLSKTNIKLKTRVDVNSIKQCRIVPKSGYYVIEVVYEVKCVDLKEDNNRYCSIDLGLNNLATVTSNVIKPIIINGKPLKSINQYYNKTKGNLQSQLEKELKRKSGKRINKLSLKRNNKITDYLHKSSRYIINHLVSNNINTLVIGNNKEWKQEINIGKVNNQNFVTIPHSRFIGMLKYKCELLGIRFIITEESYTSKCSFIDNEDICKHVNYCGNRVKRGLFKSREGILINADVNGGLNILRKAVPEISFNGIEVIAVSPAVVTL